jgi:hypothetical protein
MRIGPELFSSYFARGSFTITIPKITLSRDKFYGEWDFELVFNSALTLSKYEYGYTLKVAVLGFGFEIWIGRNI